MKYMLVPDDTTVFGSSLSIYGSEDDEFSLVGDNVKIFGVSFEPLPRLGLKRDFLMNRAMPLNKHDLVIGLGDDKYDSIVLGAF